MRRGLEAMKSKVLTDAPAEGEEVEVAAGAFKGLNGRVTRVLPAKQRVQILLDMMGRSVEAELSLEMVLFRRRDAAKLALPAAGVISGQGHRFPGLDWSVGTICAAA